jgi:hypothetical protein
MKTELLAQQQTCQLAIEVPTRGSDGLVEPVTVMAMPTPAPGLVIVPSVCGDAFTGLWRLTHAASGYGLEPYGEGLHECVEIGRELAKLPIDWTADKETVKAAITANWPAYRKAISAGRYGTPEPQDDPEGNPRQSEVAPYPCTESEATAEAITRHLARSLQHRLREGWELGRSSAETEAEAQVRVLHSLTYVHEWALAYALREIARDDRDLADGIARSVWNGWADGSTPAEELAEWVREYGLPPLPERES